MTNLKAIAQQVQEDMTNNVQWFDREVMFVLDGSHNSGAVIQKHIYDTLDTTKKNYGKRGSNLIAYCGNTAIQDMYSVNSSQAFSVWKYLPQNIKSSLILLLKIY